MARCRIGVEREPDLRNRIERWKRREGYTHSCVLAAGLTYVEAQDREAREVKDRPECLRTGAPAAAGDEHERVWAVYHVWGQ